MAQSVRWRFRNHERVQALQAEKSLKEQRPKQKKLTKKLRYQHSRNEEYRKQNYGGEDLHTSK